MKKTERTKEVKKTTEKRTPSAGPKAEVKVAPATTSAGIRKTLLLIGGLAIVTIILLILALAPSIKFNLKTTPQPTPYVSPAHTTLNITKPVAATSASALTWNSDVNISTGSNKVAAVQLEILYNPQVLGDVDIKAGGFLKNPTVLLKTIDQKAGRITYALGVGLGQKPVSGKGILAVITFTKALGKTGQTAFTFLPGTGVSASGEIVSVLKTAANTIFSLTSPTPTP